MTPEIHFNAEFLPKKPIQYEALLEDWEILMATSRKSY